MNATVARRALAVVALVASAACSSVVESRAPEPSSPGSDSVAAAPVTVAVDTSVPDTTAPSTTSTTAPDPPPTEPTGSTVAPTTTDVVVASSPPERPDELAHLVQAVFFLALDNLAVSVSVRHPDGTTWQSSAGRRLDGEPVTSDTPFVQASVSKLVTAISIARLVERGMLTDSTPVPWAELGIGHHPAWDDVTVRELLDHTSGMRPERTTWLDDPGPCTIPLTAVLGEPPTDERGTWRYSNGNYCALGLLVEYVTGQPLDVAANELVFGPAGVEGPYLTTEGLRPDSAPSPRGVARLERLGGAGTWIMSTDDVVAMLADVSAADLGVLRWPGIIADQYGWGHTGTLDGAKACAWVLHDGTTIAAVVAGKRPASGGEVCDLVLPALALDLGVWAGEPEREPS